MSAHKHCKTADKTTGQNGEPKNARMPNSLAILGLYSHDCENGILREPTLFS